MIPGFGRGTVRFQAKNCLEMLSAAKFQRFSNGAEALPAIGMINREKVLCTDFRRCNLLALDNCLYDLQATITHHFRSCIYWLEQSHAIPRLPVLKAEPVFRMPFKRFVTDFPHIDIAALRTEEGGLHIFVAID